MGDGDFRPHSSETPGPIFMKFEICNNLPDTTLHAKFQGLHRHVWSWEIASLTHESFFLCFLCHAHGSHFWTHPYAQYVIIRRSRQGNAFWGLERWKLKFDFLYSSKRKNWDSWRSMENCNRHNSRTVSHIHLKVGTDIDHSSGITWRASKVKRSKVKVTRSRNV